MAYQLAAKAPTEVVERRWPMPVPDGDGPLSVVLVDTDVTVDTNEFDGNELVLTISGGTAVTTGEIVATVTTQGGLVLVETLYIPIVASASEGQTAQDMCLFALRKIYGNGIDPDADAISDAMERLNDMLALWDASGARTGATHPLISSTALNVPSAFLMGIKYNLTLRLADHYGRQLSPEIVKHASVGLAQIKQANVADDRPQASYY